MARSGRPPLLARRPFVGAPVGRLARLALTGVPQGRGARALTAQGFPARRRPGAGPAGSTRLRSRARGLNRAGGDHERPSLTGLATTPSSARLQARVDGGHQQASTGRHPGRRPSPPRCRRCGPGARSDEIDGVAACRRRRAHLRSGARAGPPLRPLTPALVRAGAAIGEAGACLTPPSVALACPTSRCHPAAPRCRGCCELTGAGRHPPPSGPRPMPRSAAAPVPGAAPSAALPGSGAGGGGRLNERGVAPDERLDRGRPSASRATSSCRTSSGSAARRTSNARRPGGAILTCGSRSASQGRRRAPRPALPEALPVPRSDDCPPDIDLDIESDRREEAIQYVYEALRPRQHRPGRTSSPTGPGPRSLLPSATPPASRTAWSKRVSH